MPGPGTHWCLRKALCLLYPSCHPLQVGARKYLPGCSGPPPPPPQASPRAHLPTTCSVSLGLSRGKLSLTEQRKDITRRWVSVLRGTSLIPPSFPAPRSQLAVQTLRAGGPGSSPGFATHQLCALGHSLNLSVLPSDHESDGVDLPGLHVKRLDQWLASWQPSEKMLLWA